MRTAFVSVVATAALLAGATGVARAAEPSNGPTLEQLIAATRALAEQDVVMPIEEIRLAAQLAALPEPDGTIAAVRSLFDHPSFHVRRVGINAVRRIGRFAAPGLLDALVAKLRDPAGWVRYDAAWALAEAKVDRADVRAELERLANGAKIPTEAEWKTIPLGDSELRARIKAAEAVQAIGHR